MPHLLIAGSTGTGKSVGLNAMLTSILYRATPDDVRLIMIDPKRLELGMYEDIPHLLTPVVVDPKQAANALRWAVREMEERYKTLAADGVRNIEQFNRNVRGRCIEIGETPKRRRADPEPLPFIVVVIDELADLMMVAGNEVEESIARLAQMARAVGIHLILATQRPSVDVITGLIKANLPARISFRVSSKIDSRTILDGNGAEQLLGKGDMLFLPPASSRYIRLHGPYISEQESARLASFLRKQGKPVYDETITEEDKKADAGAIEFEKDDLYDEAARIVVQSGQASISYLQRRLRIGFSRAARLVDMMEAEGLCLAGRRRQAARSARGQGLLRRSRCAAPVRDTRGARDHTAVRAVGLRSAAQSATATRSDRALAATEPRRGVRSATTRSARHEDARRAGRDGLRSDRAPVFPRSGYADNALWQAAVLSTTPSTVRPGRDRDTAVRLLRGSARHTLPARSSWIARDVESPALAAVSHRRPTHRRAAGRTTAATTTAPPATPRPVPPAAPVSDAKAGRSRGDAGSARRITGITRSRAARWRARHRRARPRGRPIATSGLTDPDRACSSIYRACRLTPAPARSRLIDRRSDLVREIRLGRQPNNTTRVVLDLEGVSQLQRLHALQPVPPRHRLRACAPCWPRRRAAVCDGRTPAQRVRRPSAASAAMPAPARPVAPHAIAAADHRQPRARADERRPVPRRHRSAVARPHACRRRRHQRAASPTPPSANGVGRFSLARQLGLGVSRIVIDPGHGGHDPARTARA